MVETAEDRAALLADFGVAATYTPSGGSASTVTGIFDNAYEGASVGAGVDVATEQPRFLCRTSDVSSAEAGDALTVNSTSYTIQVVMSDGTGMTELVLEEQ